MSKGSRARGHMTPPVLTTLPRVREAREKLAEKANDILDMYLATITEAREAGEVGEALKGLQYLLEHLPADMMTGERVLDQSIDKQAKEVGQKRTTPSIKIGVAIGGLPPQQALPPPAAVEVIEVDDE